MQLANIILALGGDLNNTVPKINVTAAEIAVLQAIHGLDAVHEVEPAGEANVSNRDELVRLRSIYGAAKDSENRSHVDLLYPGAAARVFHSLDELQLAEEQFKATARAAAGKVSAPVDIIEDPVPMKAAEPAKKEPAKGKGKKAVEVEDDLDELPADDGALN